MDIIEISQHCKICGKEFICKKSVASPLAAEQMERKLRSTRRKPICSNCFKKMKKIQYESYAEAQGLPSIIGFTETQIAYAFSLRGAFCESHPGQIIRAKNHLNQIRNENIDTVSKLYRISTDQVLEVAFRDLGLYEAYVALTEVNASTLIDVFRKKSGQ